MATQEQQERQRRNQQQQQQVGAGRIQGYRFSDNRQPTGLASLYANQPGVARGAFDQLQDSRMIQQTSPVVGAQLSAGNIAGANQRAAQEMAATQPQAQPVTQPGPFAQAYGSQGGGGRVDFRSMLNGALSRATQFGLNGSQAAPVQSSATLPMAGPMAAQQGQQFSAQQAGQQVATDRAMAPIVRNNEQWSFSPTGNSFSSRYGSGSSTFGPSRGAATIEGVPANQYFQNAANRQGIGNSFAQTQQGFGGGGIGYQGQALSPAENQRYQQTMNLLRR